MPRQVAPPPSGEFSVKLQKPFNGTPTHTIEIIGEPNRPAVVRVKNNNQEKSGDVPKDDVNELNSLISALRGFPSHPSKDVYGLDTTLDLATFDIQWGNNDEDPSANEINELAAEQKDEFKRVVDSIEALSRQCAKNDSAV